MDALNGFEPLDLNDYDIEESVNAEQSPSFQTRGDDPVLEQTQMDADLGVQDLGVDDVVNTGPTRRPRPRLDADKLLNPRKGYPELLRSVRKIKYRGPGDEKKYLRKYIMTYQIWANRLWPKANFEDFTVLARRAGKDPRVRQYCRDLIENEKYGSSTTGSEFNRSREESRRDPGLEQPTLALDRDADRDADRDVDGGMDHDVDHDFDTQRSSTGASNESHNRVQEETRRIFEAEQAVSPDPALLDDFNEPNDDELEAALELYGDMGF